MKRNWVEISSLLFPSLLFSLLSTLKLGNRLLPFVVGETFYFAVMRWCWCYVDAALMRFYQWLVGWHDQSCLMWCIAVCAHGRGIEWGAISFIVKSNLAILRKKGMVVNRRARFRIIWRIPTYGWCMRDQRFFPSVGRVNFSFACTCSVHMLHIWHICSLPNLYRSTKETVYVVIMIFKTVLPHLRWPRDRLQNFDEEFRHAC